MPGTPLSLPEREEIAVALIEDRSTSWAEIARRVRRHPTTIMREVEANGGRDRYRPAIAERRAYLDSGVHHLAEARAYRWEFRPATPLPVLTPARSPS